MSEWNIINSTGSVVATAKKVEYHGKLMEERYVTVDLDSPVRLDLRAGYYMLYRGDKFTLRDSGEIEKSARPQTYGGAFTYKGLKLVAQSWQELQDTEMTDYVDDDNKIHYTGLGTFSFYMTKVSDMAYRVQAVMDNKYGTGKWVVKIGGVALTGNYSDVTVDDAKSISISSGTSVKETLDMLWTEWGYYYKVTSGMVGGELVHYVDICPNTGTALPLYYGKKRTDTVAGQTREVGGLVKIVRKINPNVEICTRLRAYGSERNLPYHWYNNKYGGINAAMYIPQLMLPHIALYYDEDGNYCDAEGNLYGQGDEGVVGPVNPWQYPNDVVLENVVASALFGKRDKEVHWNSDDMGEIFPSMKGMKASDVTGLQTKTFRNQGALDRILSFDYESSSDTGSSSPIDVTSDKVNFIVYVPNPGFNPADHNTAENVELLVQSGMCQARAFTIIKSEGCDSNGDPVTDGTGTVVQYKLTCAKVIDEEIDQVFPNSPSFEIVAGDYYVYTGLEFNGDYSQDTWLDVYVQAAEMRLLRAAALWLREHSSEDYIHEVSIDNVYMKTVPNISANLVEGAKVQIEDAQIGAYKTDIVESVTITEGKEAIPTYEITFLRRDESESLGDRVKGLVGQSISASSEIAKANDNLAKKVNKTGFHTLFDPLDAQYNVLDINGDLSNLKYIRANVDFFSIKGVAALGTTSGGGGGGGGDELNALLASINDSNIGDTTPTGSEVGKCLVYNGNNQWAWATPGGGGGTDLLSVWKSLTNNSSLSSYDNNTKIAEAHIPDLSSTYVTWSNVNRTSYSSWNKIPFVNAGGSMEIGKTIEFHSSNGGISDYDAVIMLDNNKTYNNTMLKLPNANGTLATQEWVNGMGFLTEAVTSVTPTSAASGWVVTHGSISGNQLTLNRSTLASILSGVGYKWWGRTMNPDSGIVKGGIDNASYIEFTENVGLYHGGYINFHYGGSIAEYTSRIIEDADGRISVNSAYFKSNGNVGFGTTPSDSFRVNISGNVITNGDIFAENNFAIRVKASSGNNYNNILNLTNDSPSILDVGWGSATQALCTTRIWGNATHFMNSSGTETVSLSNNGQLYVTQGTQGVRIGNALLSWEQSSNSLKVTLWDGTPCNFYSLGGIAALGATSGEGGLTELTLGKLNVTGEGVLFDDGDGVSKIYSSGGMLTFECEEDFVFGSSIDMSNCDISNASSINASSISAGSAKIQSSYVYLNTWSRLFATTVEGTRTVYLQIKNSSTNNWDIKGTWN